LVYVPLSTVAFTTLPASLRNEGTAIFNLLRNVGSSIGISVVMFLLTQNTQRLHESMGDNITPYNMPNNPAATAAHISTSTRTGLDGLNSMITNQATMVGYMDDFRLMMLITLASIPFLLLIKRVKVAAGSHVVMD
jgi:DHA2 family multidrug resistance protein